MKRRTFIQNTGLATAGVFLGSKTFSNTENKIKIGIVGVGWFGTDVHLTLMHQSGLFDIVGICDVNQVCIDKALSTCQKIQAPTPKVFKDYKEMYEMPGLQAVSIATPTHWHAAMFVDACKKGLNVMLEKPVCFDIEEGKAMLKAQKKAGNVVAINFKSLNSPAYAQAKAFIKSGEAGKINQVVGNLFFTGGGNVKELPVPSTIDYDSFCGPAPLQKFMMSTGSVRPEWKFSENMDHGPSFDWGLHYFNNARRILDLKLPQKVSAIGGKIGNNGYETADYLLQSFMYDDLNVQFHCRNFTGVGPVEDNNIGVYFYGEKATVFIGEFGWEVYQDKKPKISHGSVAFEPWLPQMNDNLSKIFINFAEGVKAKSNANIISPLEDSFHATAAMIFGNIAYKTHTELTIDTSKIDIIGNETAHKMQKRAYRKGYIHPANLV